MIWVLVCFSGASVVDERRHHFSGCGRGSPSRDLTLFLSGQPAGFAFACRLRMIFRFGRFELDEGTRELRLGARTLELQPRTFDLLVYLVRNQERVVSKDELLNALWPGVTVTDSSIMRAISLIRTALRQGGQGDAIQTFTRQGYRFVGELVDGPPAAARDRTLLEARSACDSRQW